MLGFGEREGEGGRGCRLRMPSVVCDATQAGSSAFSFFFPPNAILRGSIFDGGFEYDGIDGATETRARSDLIGGWGAI
jgi:hypothetical protein